MKFLSSSPKDTVRVATILADEIFLSRIDTKGAFVIGFSGELGVGKTIFIKSFARRAGILKKITSPTFLLMRRYNLNGKQYKNLFHIDAYRTADPKEFKKIGLHEILDDKKNIVLIEWVGKIKKILPKDMLIIKIVHGDKSAERIISVGRRNSKRKK